MTSKTGMSSLDFLERLVAFNTISRLSNLEIIGFIEDHLNRFGIACERVPDATGEKANLYATIGPADRSGVLLSGHTDVVPVDGQAWSSAPFSLSVRGGKAYGRGSADMKGFIACVLAALPRMAAANLTTPIHFAFSHDEEVGCVGVRSLIARLRDRTPKPAMCIVGEPTEMQVVVAHKGKQYLRAHVTGLECHAAMAPQGVNAIEYAADLIVFIRGLAERKIAQGPFDPDYDIPHTTLMTGLIGGGINLNTVPRNCWFDYEIRDMPPEAPEPLQAEIEAYAREVLVPRMRTTAPDADIRFDEVSLRPSLETAPGEEVVTLVKELVGRDDHGKVSFGTEAALFQKSAGIQTVVCGPGNIAQAHKPNEFISLDQLEACDAFLARLVARCEAAI